MASSKQSRGTGWVVVQFVVMIALVVAGPVFRNSWNSNPARFLGGVLFLVGAWVGIRGDRDLGRHRTPYPQPKDDGELVMTGIYAWVRHPLYFSLILLGFGWALLWRSSATLVLAVVQLIFLDAKARLEERRLADRFPEYPAYASRVRRFLPGIY